MKIICAGDYGIRPEDSRFLTWKLRNLLNTYRGQEGISLRFSPGTYHFYPDYAEEVLLCIPNHDEDTIKKVAFNLEGYRELHLIGEQSNFVFHTDILPFLLRNCNSVTIEKINVDYERPGYSEGIIQKVEPRRMEIAIDQEQFPYYVRGNRVYFYGENYCSELERWMEMDPIFARPVSGLVDRTFNLEDAGENASYTMCSSDILEVVLLEGEKEFEAASKQGNHLILRHHPRNYPAFYLEESKNISLCEVEIYHALAMGVIATRTKHITLERVRVMRHPQKQHMFTAEADAFHFVSCKGNLKIQKCLCENQLDDAVNIHGIYGKVKDCLEDGSFTLELVHHQHKGAEIVKNGEKFRILCDDTMLPYAERIAQRVERLNKDYLLIYPEKEIVGLKSGHVIENMEWMPDVLVEECTFRHNRGRGVLCTSGGKVIIRKNYFQVPGAAILVEGDSKSWFESGAVEHVVVENNVFDSCAYVPDWGKAPIQITPSAQKLVDGKAYHQKIEIIGNTFRTSDKRLIYACNIAELVWKDNTVEQVEDFPPVEGEAFVTEHILRLERLEKAKKKKDEDKKLIIFIDSGDTLMNEETEIRKEEGGVVYEADIIPGAKKMLESLKREGYSLVLVADGYKESFVRVYEKHQMQGLFNAMVISQTVGEEKPSERMFQKAMEALGLLAKDKYRIIMVGNNLKRDIAGANRFGIHSVLMKWSPRYNMVPENQDEEPEYIITQPYELVALAGKLEKMLTGREGKDCD